MNSKLEEISEFLSQQKILTLGKLEKNLHEIQQRFHVKLIGSGISRFVFKEKYSRKVLKVTTEPKHNLSEYCLYNGFEGTKLQSLFAASTNISQNGTVLEQEYVGKRIPAYYDDLFMSSYTGWEDFTEPIRDCLTFLKYYTKERRLTFDFHNDNIRLDSNYNAKIIDYAPILSPFLEVKKISKEACISGLNSYTRKHDQRVEFFLDQKKSLVFKTQFDTNKLTLED